MPTMLWSWRRSFGSKSRATIETVPVVTPHRYWADTENARTGAIGFVFCP